VIYLTFILIFLFVILWVLAVMRKNPAVHKNQSKEYIKGLEALLDNDRETSIAYFRKAFEKDQNNTSAYLRLGDLLREDGSPEKALRIHQNLMVKPALPSSEKKRVLKSLMADYKALEKYKEAAVYIQKLLRTGIQDISLHKDLLDFYENIGEWDKAKEEKKRTLTLEKKDAKKGMAEYCTYIAGKLTDTSIDKAKSFIKISERYDRDYPFIHYVKGLIGYKNGDKSLALNEWKDFIRKVPKAAFLVGTKIEEILFETGKFSEAAKIYEGILEKSPLEPEIIMLYANILINQGNFKKAQNLLEQVYETRPNNQILYLLFQVYEKTDKDKALEIVEKFQDNVIGKSQYKCKECNYETEKFDWKCDSCGAHFSLFRVWD